MPNNNNPNNVSINKISKDFGLSDEFVSKLRDLFEENYERLLADGEGRLTEYAKELAFQQVLYYYKKSKEIAENVSDTEVRLTLPGCTTPKGRRFTIEGVVDIVKEEGGTWMYDIKTHDLEYVHAHKEMYVGQLNIYAHIWQQLRQQVLDNAAIISTTLPTRLRQGIKFRNEKLIEAEYQKWEPLVPIEFSQEMLQQTIDGFGKTVDQIEERKFIPPGVKELSEKLEGTRHRFAKIICASCDAKYSCRSYREYIIESKSGKQEAFIQYIEDDISSDEKDELIHACLQAGDDDREMLDLEPAVDEDQEE